MSTIVAVRKGDQVCLAADTLTMWGSTRLASDLVVNHQKLGRFGSSYIATVGPAVMQTLLRSYFSSLDRQPELGSVDQVYEAFRHLHRRLKEEYYLNPSEESDDPFESSRFHCLVVNPSGIYGVYALRTVHEYGRYFAFGSGSEYALGALHALYNRLASARRIATAALDAACTFDDSSDLPATVKTMRIRKPRAAQRTR
ncbi:MAG: hypothetical protein KDA21_01915 [Phycisphaerales bacterium]|nr:hypothetical protein [Phycisphaerales bacterium]